MKDQTSFNRKKNTKSHICYQEYFNNFYRNISCCYLLRVPSMDILYFHVLSWYFIILRIITFIMTNLDLSEICHASLRINQQPYNTANLNMLVLILFTEILKIRTFLIAFHGISKP